MHDINFESKERQILLSAFLKKVRSGSHIFWIFRQEVLFIIFGKQCCIAFNCISDFYLCVLAKFPC